jgi:hypothetical protein
MKTREEYIDGLASELKEWGAQIDLLADKTQRSVGMVKLKYIQEVDALHTRQQAATQKMQELRGVGDDAWDLAVENTDKVWSDFRTGLAKAASKFK